MSKPRDESRAGWLRLLGGVALTPCAAGAASLSHAILSEQLGSATAFAGAAVLPVLGLALAATCLVRLSVTLGVALVAGSLLIAFSYSPANYSATPAAYGAVDAALVGLAWALGTSLGRRVQHASHLLPACVVAACADLLSLLSPEGPTHAIAKSGRALSVLATWFPVPGTHAVAPALGVGDLLFMGLVFGVARARSLPYARTVGSCVAGTALAGLAAAILGTAIPALLPIAICVLVALPATRQLRAADRKAATWSMLIAASVALAALARNFLVRP